MKTNSADHAVHTVGSLYGRLLWGQAEVRAVSVKHCRILCSVPTAGLDVGADLPYGVMSPKIAL